MWRNWSFRILCDLKKNKLNDEKFSCRQEEKFDVFDIFLPFSAGTDAVACYVRLYFL